MSQSPLTVLVEFQVRKETTTPDEWLQVWGKRGLDALEGEPETAAYEALKSNESSDNILVFERYEKGQQSLDAHMARPSHDSLVSEMANANMTKRRVMSNFFDDIPDYGWWSRPDRNRVLRDRELQMTLLVTRFPSQEARQEYIALTGSHAEYCRENEAGTLMYSGGIAQRDADRGPQIKAGDLLFVAVFADTAAAEQHNIDPNHLALQPKIQEIPRQRIMVQRYQTTGAGFLWAGR